jgi:hypothetical protein
MPARPHRYLRCILFPGEQAEDPTFGFTVLILIALPLAIGGLLTGGHAAEVTESVATAATAAAADPVATVTMTAAVAELAAMAAAEMARHVTAARVSIQLR